MKICFVEPCSGRYPIGGHRIVYEYANRLTDIGHEVHILHVTRPDVDLLSTTKLWRSRLQFLRDKMTGGYRPTTWFKLNDKVKTSCHFTLASAVFEPGDAVVATAWQTAPTVASLPEHFGRKYYFIQHLESWNSDPERLMSTWTLPLEKIVIAQWLGDVAAGLGERFKLVPNAIDLSFFKMDRAPAQRSSRSLLLQSHHMDWKGTMDAIEALRILKSQGLDVDLTLFGMTSPTKLGIDVPHRFFHNPPQTVLRQLYNDNAIFVSASWSEGWGLTPHEAAACGAALAVTDVGGHREFLRHAESALMSPPKDPAALAEHIATLLVNDDRRIALALNAHNAVQSYTWARSTAALEHALSR